jgi:hypothetical protein
MGYVHYECRDASGNEIITLNYNRIIDSKETPKAYCVVFGDEAVWLPKSQVEDIRETANEIDLPRWLAEAKGLEGYQT